MGTSYDSYEPLRLLMLNVPWCPPMSSMVEGAGAAMGSPPPGPTSCQSHTRMPQARSEDEAWAASCQPGIRIQGPIPSSAAVSSPGAVWTVLGNALGLLNLCPCFRDQSMRKNYKHSFPWILGYFAYLG